MGFIGLAATFKDKVVVITGGTSGIGRELVLQLAAMEARVYFCGRNEQAGQAVAEASESRAGFFAADVKNKDDVSAFIDTVIRTAGHIDYVFHCAGVILGGEIRDNELSEIENVLQTNVMGTAYVSHYVYQIMAQQGYGHLINVSSGAGLFPLPLMGVYSSSKFFVYGLSETLRMEGKGLGVRVSTVAPGIVDTPIYDSGHYSNTDGNSAKNLVKNKLFTMTASKAALRILKGTRRNRTVIHTQFYVRSSWMSYRYFPHVFRFVVTRMMGPYRQKMRGKDLQD